MDAYILAEQLKASIENAISLRSGIAEAMDILVKRVDDPELDTIIDAIEGLYHQNTAAWWMASDLCLTVRGRKLEVIQIKRGKR